MEETFNQSLPNLTLTDSPFDAIAQFTFPTLIKVTTYIMICIVVTAVLLDLAILITFARHSHRLITPFTVHVVNMTVINLLVGALSEPLMYYRNLDREAFRGNVPLCSAFKYLQWSARSWSSLEHCIICGDRWLALLHPIWYRSKTVSFGMKATLLAVLYQQTWYLPLFISDVLHVTDGDLCDFTAALMSYQHVTRATTFLLPQALLFLSYPFLVHKIRQRTRTMHATTPAMEIVARQTRTSNELRLALWLLGLQIVFCMPYDVVSILSNVRSGLPYFLDIQVMFSMTVMVMLVIDPVVYLIFVDNLRQELILGLRGLMCGTYREGGTGPQRPDGGTGVDLSTTRALH